MKASIFRREFTICTHKCQLHHVLRQRADQLANEHARLVHNEQQFSQQQSLHVSRLASVSSCYNKYLQLETDLKELKELAKDESLKSIAQHELTRTKTGLKALETQLTDLILPRNPFSERGCLLEIRPGVGGSEAMIFAADLLKMYEMLAQRQGWSSKLLSQSLSTCGSGITEAILSIDTPGAYSVLQFEGGVHRVQRVPATETKGRLHTSTAAVVVLPQMMENVSDTSDEGERSFSPGEVRVDVMRARGAGGQHVNTTDSAVRLVHIPTGIVVCMQDERSQHRNKARAFMVLRARLAERQRVEELEKAKLKRSTQVTTTMRSDKIRTYNYNKNRVTDHRCDVSCHNLEELMKGEGLTELSAKLAEHFRNEELNMLVG